VLALSRQVAPEKVVRGRRELASGNEGLCAPLVLDLSVRGDLISCGQRGTRDDRRGGREQGTCKEKGREREKERESERERESLTWKLALLVSVRVYCSTVLRPLWKVVSGLGVKATSFTG
jgi:hypothetical protein